MSASYEETLEKLFQTSKVGRSWDAWIQLLALFGHPENSFRSVHIAGTNGKGSVSLKIATALELQGYKTGLYTSPHIIDYTERIKINRTPIPKDYVTLRLQEIFSHLETLGRSWHFFEVTTLLCFLYFQEQQVDFAVVEVGIGGLMDNTNVITPEVSVITSIGYDHTDLLGKTLESIAYQKAGIVKPGVPCVIGPSCPKPVFQTKCATTGSQLIEVPDVPGATYEAENNLTTVTALQALQSRAIQVSEEHIQTALRSRQPFRFQKVSLPRKNANSIDLILDVGHNPTAISRVFSDIEKTYADRPLQVVLGMSANKDIDSALRVILGKARKVHCFSIPHPRLMESERLYALVSDIEAQKAGICGGKEVIREVALSCNEEDLILICGSCFIMSAAKEELEALGCVVPVFDKVS